MKIINGSVWTGSDFNDRILVLDKERVASSESESASSEILDAAGCYVVPGFIDIHFHGSRGADLCDGTHEALSTIARYQASRGITAICPATMTFPEKVLSQIMTTVSSYRSAANESEVVGINMEGPFISAEKIGAQNPRYVQVPDIAMLRRLQQSAQGLIKLVDIAPEEPGAIEFIDEMAREVCISVAHTAADYDCAREAFNHGARQLTHMYNAMASLHHREPGPIPAAWENPAVNVELITDGVHIHPAMVRLAFALFGPDRVILISDSMRACGLEDGVYDLGGQEVHVAGNEARLEGGTIAGSVTDLSACLRWAVLKAGISLSDAIRAATINPARAIGIDNERGSLEVGSIADVVLLDKESLNVVAVVVRGELL